jgi:hypothetical protein
MPVFLSHKSEDTAAALAAAHYLSNRGIRFYLDVLDPELETVDDLTSRLVDQIRQSTHLLAVVSSYTVQSWWVPFEIGVATELDRRMATYSVSPVQLPDYLQRWPVLTLPHHLKLFADLYDLDTAVTSPGQILRYQTGMPKTANRFHDALKGAMRSP